MIARALALILLASPALAAEDYGQGSSLDGAMSTKAGQDQVRSEQQKSSLGQDESVKNVIKCGKTLCGGGSKKGKNNGKGDGPGSEPPSKNSPIGKGQFD